MVSRFSAGIHSCTEFSEAVSKINGRYMSQNEGVAVEEKKQTGYCEDKSYTWIDEVLVRRWVVV